MAQSVPVPERALRKRSAQEVRRGWSGRFTPLLFLVPAAVALASVSVYPILDGVRLSLRDTLLSTQDDNFVGLANYAALAEDDQFWSAWQHTLAFTAASTLLETLLGLGMALVLYEPFRGRGAVRAAMLIPWAIPTVVTSKMFGWLFDGQHGVINWLLVQAGLISDYVNWYGSPDTAFASIIAADVWKTAPFMALLLLAGLQTIPHSLVEAARIDGAGPWQAFWHVRLPLLLPTLLIAGMFRALDAFRIFDLVYVLTGGGPADSTEVLSTLTYKTLFSGLQFGYGSALASAMFLTEAVLAAGFGIYIVRRMRQANG
ncbi:carbohydrate ABC transporter permease [Labrys wisconsinensis]|uniref:Multiple sugar transport system permease protein n=1 Tax=Labrys wisconsinensis TaxID=425677 RepID=A0ABU0J470_9HYPH|nr:sugar ABC transporter permease [Labrys wisconsinensis]MDQ0469072.1 multiple sugar transport system permease protein [Labrys wisconsinensis]